MNNNAKRIDSIVRFIKLWKKNIRFYNERIIIQSVGKNHSSRSYSYIDIELEQNKINKAKELLKTL